MTHLTSLILTLTILSGAVGYSLALLAIGIMAPGIAQLIVYGGLLVLFWHETVDPLWGPWTRKNIAKRKAEQEAWRASRPDLFRTGATEACHKNNFIENKTT